MMNPLHLDASADWLTARLKEKGFHVMHYRSRSTSTIYLKLDFGMNYTIRISDHSGKEKLAFKYNVLAGLTAPTSTVTEQGHFRHFYPLSMVEKMVNDIVRARERLMTTSGVAHYMEEIQNKKAEAAMKKRAKAGFWRVAVEA